MPDWILRRLFPEHFEFKERKQLNEDFLKVASTNGFVIIEIWENTLGTNYALVSDPKLIE